MDEDELIEIDGELRALLQRLGLAWVLVQVDDAIREGHWTRVIERSRGEDYFFVAPVARVQGLQEPSSATLTDRHPKSSYITEPYTLQERVLLLVDATEKAIVDSIAIEAEIVAFTTEQSDSYGLDVTVRFVDESELIPSRVIQREEVESRASVLPDLRAAIQALRVRIAE